MYTVDSFFEKEQANAPLLGKWLATFWFSLLLFFVCTFFLFSRLLPPYSRNNKNAILMLGAFLPIFLIILPVLSEKRKKMILGQYSKYF
jgi:hypothetical protein